VVEESDRGGETCGLTNGLENVMAGDCSAFGWENLGSKMDCGLVKDLGVLAWKVETI
jgi:hypothetical protein